MPLRLGSQEAPGRTPTVILEGTALRRPLRAHDPRDREVLDREARRRGVIASELVRELVRAANYGRVASGAKKFKPEPD